MMIAALKGALCHVRTFAFVGMIALASQAAYASPIDSTNDRPVTPDTDDLQDLFEDELITKNVDNWDVLDSQLPSGLYKSTGLSGSFLRIAHLDDNFVGAFGIFDAHDITQKIEVYSSDDGAAEGDGAGLEWFSDGTVKKNFTTEYSDWSREFGFYVEDAQGNFYYSVDALNKDEAFAVIYRGDDLMNIKLPTVPEGDWTDNEYFIAFTNSTGDKTFTDIVVLMESIQPTPEPGTLVLLGAGMVAVIAIRRRRKA